VIPPSMFGVLMGLSLAVSLRVLGRPTTGSSLAGAANIGFAAMLSAWVAVIAASFLVKRPWSARYAASLLILIAGTGALTTVQLVFEMAWQFGHLTNLPPGIAGLILANLGAAALYYFLTIPGILILPLAMPLIFATAAFIARRWR
jgi:hypothetical protein